MRNGELADTRRRRASDAVCEGVTNAVEEAGRVDEEPGGGRNGPAASQRRASDEPDATWGIPRHELDTS